MAISVRMSKDDEELVRSYAEMKGKSVSDLVRESVLYQIDEEMDLETYKEALEEYKKDPVTYTTDEVIDELGIK